MKRSGFKPSRPPRPATQTTYTPRARTPAPAAAPDLRQVAAVEKFAYVRDERLRAMCRAMACQRCLWEGPDAGVTWAHSNWSEHGKGKGIKASDVYVAALCWVCHGLLDQGNSMTEADKRLLWDRAHRATVTEGQRLGLWPANIAAPGIIHFNRTIQP